MNEVNENVTVNGAGTQERSLRQRIMKPKRRSSSVLENTA
mgnify:CR=1 FL=1